MPSVETAILNRAAACDFAIGDTLSAINARYKRRVENDLGISLTGFVATATYGAINFHVDNQLDVFLFEDIPNNLDTDINGLNFEAFLLAYWTVNITRLAGMIQERFLTPYQLRPNHEYVLLARLLLNVAPTPPINIRLTALGYENVQQPQRVFLR